MNGLLILADGFEDTEALTTRDILMRAGINVTTASISSFLEVKSSFGLKITTDLLLKQIKDLSCYDCVILPGGGMGTKNLLGCEFLKAYLDDFVLHDKVVAAICAAPSVLGKFGYLENKKFTCFAGFNHGFGGKFTGAEVEIDGNIITGRSMQYTVGFALTIVEKLLGENPKKLVKTQIEGLTSK